MSRSTVTAPVGSCSVTTTTSVAEVVAGVIEGHGDFARPCVQAVQQFERGTLLMRSNSAKRENTASEAGAILLDGTRTNCIRVGVGHSESADMRRVVLEETYDLFRYFYTTPRASADLLSDSGGPFGFDIHAALAVDYLIRIYGIKRIIETGTSRGDTADYLSRLYPSIEIDTVEADPELAAFAALRLRGHENVTVHQGDSAEILRRLAPSEGPTLYYLDAHGASEWPLLDEIRAVRGEAVVVIDDFDVGAEPFHYDTYDGVRCDMSFIRPAVGQGQEVFALSGEHPYPYPCLQMVRRGGKAIFTHGLPSAYLSETTMFRRLEQ